MDDGNGENALYARVLTPGRDRTPAGLSVTTYGDAASVEGERPGANGLRPSEAGSWGLHSPLGALGLLAVASEVPDALVRAYAGLRLVLHEDRTNLNQEQAAMQCGMTKHRLFDRRMAAPESGSPSPRKASLADQLGELGMVRAPGNHMNFLPKENGSFVAEADTWVFDDDARLPLRPGDLVSTIEALGRAAPESSESIHTVPEGQSGGLLSDEQRELLTDPSREAWNLSGYGMGLARPTDVADDAAFRLWVVLLAHFEHRRLRLSAPMIAKELDRSPDTAARALRHLKRLGVLREEATGARLRTYVWDLDDYLSEQRYCSDTGDINPRRPAWPWRLRSTSAKPVRDGREHVAAALGGTYRERRLDAATVKSDRDREAIRSFVLDQPLTLLPDGVGRSETRNAE